MNPKEIGSLEPPIVEPKKIPEPELKPPSQGRSETDPLFIKYEDEEDDSNYTKSLEADEHILVNQEFLLDPDITVREFLVQNSIEVLDFVRYECGEVIEPTYCE